MVSGRAPATHQTKSVGKSPKSRGTLLQIRLEARKTHDINKVLSTELVVHFYLRKKSNKRGINNQVLILSIFRPLQECDYKKLPACVIATLLRKLSVERIILALKYVLGLIEDSP